jgi:acetolactate decarboxylase
VKRIQGLTFGDYNGSLSAKEVKALGDTGIGTFDGLNGLDVGSEWPKDI